MAEETIWKLDIQPGSSQATLKAFENSLTAVKDRIAQVASAGENFQKLDTLQTKAAEAAKRLEVAQASAAVALKKAQDATDGGKASAEQIALAQARAALAAQKIETAENAVSVAMQKTKAEADRLAAAMEASGAKIPILVRALDSAKSVLGLFSPLAQAASQGISALADKTTSASNKVSSQLKVAETAVKSFSSKLSNDAVSSADEFSAKMAELGVRIGTSVSGMADKAGASFLAFGSRVGSVLSSFGSKINDASQPAVNFGTRIAVSLSNAASIINDKLTFAGQSVQAFSNRIISVASTPIIAFITKLTEAGQAVKSFSDRMISIVSTPVVAFVAKINAAGQAVQSFAITLAGNVSSAVQAFQNRIIAASQPAIDFGLRVGSAVSTMASNVATRLVEAGEAVASFSVRVATATVTVASRVTSGFGQAGLILLGFGIKAADGLGQASSAFLKMTGLEPVVSAFTSRVQSAIDSMVGNIKEKFASLAAPFASFGQRIAESSPPVASFGASVRASLNGIAGAAAQLPEKMVSATGSILSGFQNAASGALDFASKIGMAVFGVKQLAQSAISLAQGLFQPAATAEQTAKSLEVLMGSASAAKKEMQDLNTFAAKTPFQTQDIDNAAQKLLAVGVNAKDVIPDITALGDGLAAMSKTSGADLEQIVSNFDKIKTQGHLTTEVMQSFADQGIDAWAIMEKQTGKTHDQLANLISSGLIPADQAMKQLTSGIEASPLYGGQMANAASTFNGLMSTLTSLWNQSMAALAGPSMQLAEQGLSKLGDTLSSPSFTNFASGVGQKIAGAFQSISDFIIKNDIAGKVQKIGENLSKFFDNPNIQQFSNLIGHDLVNGFNNFMNAASSPSFGKFIGLVGSLTGGALLDLRNLLINVGSAAQKTADFFEKNEVAMALLKGTLAAFAIIVLAAVVPAFIGWAIAAGAAAVATIAATWPILAIGAVIALVVAGIILAINHWGDIVKWFQGLWAGFTKWLADSWETVHKNFDSGVNTIKTSLAAAWKSIQDNAGTAWHAVINTIINVLNGGITGIEDFVNFFGDAINWIADKLHAGKPMGHFSMNKIPAYASGTDSHPGGPAIVGERGPELLMLPRGASVLPNDKTMALLAMMGEKVPGYAGGIGDAAGDFFNWIAGGAKSLLDNALSMLNVSAPKLPGVLSDIGSHMLDTVKDFASGFIDKILPKFDFGGADAPGDLKNWIAAAMALTGAPGNWAGPLAVIAMHESGGNPNAINLTDSNAQAGHPSQGIMQTIPSTFAAYALPGHTNILDPISNIIAGIRYIMSRYGTVFNVPGIKSMASGGPYIGYANGGLISEPIMGFGLRSGTRYAFGENGPELVVPRPGFASSSGISSGGGNDQAVALLSRILAVLEKQGRATNTTLNANVASGSMNAQKINQLVQSLSGFDYEAIARGAF